MLACTLRTVWTEPQQWLDFFWVSAWSFCIIMRLIMPSSVDSQWKTLSLQKTWEMSSNCHLRNNSGSNTNDTKTSQQSKTHSFCHFNCPPLLFRTVVIHFHFLQAVSTWISHLCDLFMSSKLCCCNRQQLRHVLASTLWHLCFDGRHGNYVTYEI